jgi:predicted transglutaminase-like cysteine proteinase
MLLNKAWQWRDLVALLIGLLLATLILAARDAHAGLFKPDIFGARSAHATDLKMFPKWRGTMTRFQKELSDCPTTMCNKPSWSALVDGLKGADLKTQLKKVHGVLNKHLYIVDPINWNLPDYWATPFQFLRKNGDCEDYAIAKFMALRALGVPSDIMRIVVLNDLNLGLAHAILVVDVDGTPMVLDNQIKGVVAASSIHHYQPVYAVNDKGWWLYNTGG